MSSEDRRRFLARVGVSTPEHPVFERRMSSTSKHRGWAGLSLESVKQSEALFDDLEPVPGVAALLWMAPTQEPLYHANAEEGLWLLDPTALDVPALEGATTDDDGRILLDARKNAAFALVRRDERSVLLEFEGADMHAFVLDEAPPSRWEIDVPRIETPKLDPVVLMAPLPIHAWMHEKLSNAEKSGPFEKVCAVGTLARLWSSRDAIRAGLDVERQLRENNSPGDRARAWYATFGEAARQATVQGVLRSIDRLEQTLEDLVELVSSRNETMGLVARDWIERRDDLESAFVVMRESEDGAMLEHALRALDEVAKSYASTWRMIHWPPPTARLEACIEEEPYQWWSQLWR